MRLEYVRARGEECEGLRIQYRTKTQGEHDVHWQGLGDRRRRTSEQRQEEHIYYLQREQSEAMISGRGGYVRTSCGHERKDDSIVDVGGAAEPSIEYWRARERRGMSMSVSVGECECECQ